MAAAAITAAIIGCGSNHPSSLPRNKPNTRAARPVDTRICPGTSARRGRGSRDSGTHRTVIASVINPIGTLIKKIARQSNNSVSNPPTSGPTANAPPIVAPYAARAVARWGPFSNTSASKASEQAKSTAPPIP